MTAANLHFDIDAYYSSVETALRPELRGQPVAVGGVGPSGVIASANYPARQRGVRSAMPVTMARSLAPNLVLLPPRFEAYRRVSQVIAETAAQLGETTMTSPDEGSIVLDPGDLDPLVWAQTRAAELQGAIAARTGLACSVGIARSLSIAKIASELAKPGGIRSITDDQITDTLGPLPVRVLPGVGPVTAGQLNELGITTVAELRAAPATKLARHLGVRHLDAIAAVAAGDDPAPAQRSSHQSGAERSFDRPISDPGELLELALAVAGDAYQRRADRSISGITVKLRSVERRDLTRSRAIRPPTLDLGWLRSCVESLTAAAASALNRPIRLVGVSFELSDIPAQPELFPAAEKLELADRPEPGLADIAWAHMQVAHPAYGTGKLISLDDAGWVVRFADTQRIFSLGAPLTEAY